MLQYEGRPQGLVLLKVIGIINGPLRELFDDPSRFQTELESAGCYDAETARQLISSFIAGHRFATLDTPVQRVFFEIVAT